MQQESKPQEPSEEYLLNLFINRIDTLNRLLYSTGRTFDKKKLSDINLGGFIFLDLLKRINFNVDSIHLLSLSLNTRRHLKPSIGLLFRSCLVDALTGSYLLTLVEDVRTFSNEINVINRDYLNYIETVINEEADFLSYLHKHSESELDKVGEFKKAKISDIFSRYPDLLDNEGKLRSIKCLRSTSKTELFFSKEFKISASAQEKLMFQQIKENPHGTRKVSYMYILMRYYAQYQHYSYAGRDMIDMSIYNDLVSYIRSLGQLFYVSRAIFQYLNAEEIFIDQFAIETLNFGDETLDQLLV